MTILSDVSRLGEVEDRKELNETEFPPQMEIYGQREQDGKAHNAGTSQKNVGVGDRILETARQKPLGMGDPGPLI